MTDKEEKIEDLPVRLAQPQSGDGEASMIKDATSAVRQCFFSSKPCLHSHIHKLLQHKEAYLHELQQTLLMKGAVADLSQATKSRILAALHMMGESKVVATFLQHCDVVEITKACQMLDRPRQLRQLENRKQNIISAHPNLEKTKEDSKSGPKKPRGIDRCNKQIKEINVLIDESHTEDMECYKFHKDPAVREIIMSASLSGSLAKKIRHWAKTSLSSSFLEFVVLTGSMDYWKTLADLVHFKPRDFALPYFMAAVHQGTTAAAPDGSFVQMVLSLPDKAEGDELVHAFSELAEKHTQVYESFNFLRTLDERVLQHDECAKLLVEHIPLGTAVWYLDDMEELAKTEGRLAKIVGHRLETEKGWMDESSKVVESFGKVVERILTFKSKGWNKAAQGLLPAARRTLNALKETWSVTEDETEDESGNNGLTVVIGDKSASMQHAIRAATIIATMISTCFNAELVFVDGEVWESPHPRPSTVEHVLEICEKVVASGDTCLSAALWLYLEKKKKIDRLVVVSDENDLVLCKGLNFAEMVKKYRDEVNQDLELVMVCIGEGTWSMYRDMSLADVQHKRINIDEQRPDLSKFDSLINRIALLSKSGAESDLEKVKRVWESILHFADQLYGMIEQEKPQVSNPLVCERFPGEALYGKINGQLLGMRDAEGKCFAMKRSYLKQMVDDRRNFKANMQLILDWLEVWQGDE